MRFMLAFFCLFAGASAFAQSGVSNQRDTYGNLIRPAGTYSLLGINQGPTNNGPVSTAPAQPPTSNLRTDRGTSR